MVLCHRPDLSSPSRPRYTSSMQPVSIIATVLNEFEDIGRLVPSLLAQVPPAAEVIILDGGSTEQNPWSIMATE